VAETVCGSRVHVYSFDAIGTGCYLVLSRLSTLHMAAAVLSLQFQDITLPPALRICTSPDAVHRQLKIHYWQQAFLRTESLSACASESANRPLCETARL